ncbi:PfkB family carbohydrate kinase, partial [Streptomyces anulatus]|uniref:PfkB family carbohydrate kinase n=1 Tax=Streptomyces anulatus TaxID=1892 RepID=UPI00365ED398
MSGPAAGTADAATTTDVVCLGESMVTFLPSQPGRLADVPSFGRGIGGAESNVACALAAAGHRAAWVGRVGADGVGAHLVEPRAAERGGTTPRPPPTRRRAPVWTYTRPSAPGPSTWSSSSSAPARSSPARTSTASPG